MIPQWLVNEVEKYELDFITPPKTILDLGANVGAFSLWAHRQWPEAFISAFEPCAENFKALKENLTGISAKCYQEAVRATGGEEWINVGDRSVTNSFHSLGRQTASLELVKSVTAATLISHELVKIDTEGCELEIIQSLNLSATKALVCEYHRSEDVAPIKAILSAAGFQFLAQRPANDTTGILKFARPGVVQIHKQNLFIAVPVYGGGSPVEFWQSLMKFQAAPCCNYSLSFLPGDSLVSRARNTLTAKFLDSNCTHLLFIDSDLVFSAEQIQRLLDHDKDVVAGFYPKKKDGPAIEWVCNVFNGISAIDADGLQRIDYAGTGFLLIKRAVFERMIEAYGAQLKYHPDSRPQDIEYDFWSVGVYEDKNGFRRYLSEDWFFCQRWLDLGGKIYGDTRVILRHIGAASYPLQHQEKTLTAGEPNN